ncbi:hypothetical protein ABKN59_010298 [Abortiporus biennis]
MQYYSSWIVVTAIRQLQLTGLRVVGNETISSLSRFFGPPSCFNVLPGNALRPMLVVPMKNVHSVLNLNWIFSLSNCLLQPNKKLLATVCVSFARDMLIVIQCQKAQPLPTNTALSKPNPISILKYLHHEKPVLQGLLENTRQPFRKLTLRNLFDELTHRIL